MPLLLTFALTGVVAAQSQPGLVDTGFDPGSATDGAINAVAVEPDGKLLIGGGFKTVNGKALRGIARLKEDGGLDESFSPGTGTDGEVLSVMLQGNGKVLIGGRFNFINGINRSYVARLNSDGSLDPSFSANAIIASNSTRAIQAILVQPDGKVLVGGTNLAVGQFNFAIARLNPDGSLDPSFRVGVSLWPFDNVFTFSAPSISAIALAADGKILVEGFFFSIDSQQRNGIARLNPDGHVDTTFNSSIAGVISVQPDRKVVIGGGNQIIRVNIDGLPDDGFQNLSVHSTKRIGPHYSPSPEMGSSKP